MRRSPTWLDRRDQCGLERKGRQGLFSPRRARGISCFSSVNDLHYAKPAPVAARRDTFEIDERMAADGSVVRAMDGEAATAVVRAALEAQAYDAVAICFLNGYLNPAHEEQLAEIVRGIDTQHYV